MHMYCKCPHRVLGQNTFGKAPIDLQNHVRNLHAHVFAGIDPPCHSRLMENLPVELLLGGRCAAVLSRTSEIHPCYMSACALKKRGPSKFGPKGTTLRGVPNLATPLLKKKHGRMTFQSDPPELADPTSPRGCPPESFCFSRSTRFKRTWWKCSDPKGSKQSPILGLSSARFCGGCATKR